jgi:hypothetical protein
VLPILMSASIRAETDTQLIKASPETRQVGIAYAAWHDQIPWGKTWDVPQLGQYLSTDESVIRQHAAWLSDADVDFIYIDWSMTLTPESAPITGSKGNCLLRVQLRQFLTNTQSYNVSQKL